MKTKRTIIAACIATLFLSGTVFAKDTWEYHESGWNNVKSYGKVVIAQDSVGQWGPWEDFVEPAAGAPAPVAMPGMSGGDQYRNNPDIIVIPTPTPTPETKGCAAGAWCGYAIFKDSTHVRQSGGWDYRSLSYEGDGYNFKKYSPALFTLMLTPDSLPISSSWYGTSGTASWGLEPLNGAEAPNFANSGSPQAVRFYEYLNHFHDQGEGTSLIDGVSHGPNWGYEAALMFATYDGDRHFDKAITGTLYKVGEEPIYWKGKIIGWRDVYVTLKADPDVAIGQFERQSVESYTSGTGESAITTTTTKTTTGYYVAGIATPQSYLDSQRAGNVTANYVGGSFDGSQQGKVDITVKFAPGTWSGNWSQN
ncbi:MAG: hypothetical protein H6R16_1862, partial [Proteobacteria bacterium]|nr:hypothetical protein [Pseudomonadota bacterium]